MILGIEDGAIFLKEFACTLREFIEGTLQEDTLVDHDGNKIIFIEGPTQEEKFQAWRTFSKRYDELTKHKGKRSFKRQVIGLRNLCPDIDRKNMNLKSLYSECKNVLKWDSLVEVDIDITDISDVKKIGEVIRKRNPELNKRQTACEVRAALKRVMPKAAWQDCAISSLGATRFQRGGATSERQRRSYDFGLDFSTSFFT